MPYRIKIVRFLAISALLLPIWQTAYSQTGASARLSNLDSQSFPSMEAFLEVNDANGQFILDLQPAQVSIYEDGNQIEIDSLDVIRQGVQFVTVFNPGPSFGVRDSKGISRYDFLKGAVGQWAVGRQGSTLDDLSLLITNGPSISHTTDPMKFASALQSENINAREAIPSLDTLYSAITVASDPTPRPGMGRVVLFITPPLDSQDISLDNLISQANEYGILIYVWMVTTQGTFSSVGVQRLNDLASRTGGWVFTYTGDETLPNPEDYLVKERDIYRLTYQSEVTSSGIHQVSAKITSAEGIIETAPETFEIILQPPVPAVISPPIQIQRKPPSDLDLSQQKITSITEYIPKEQSLQIIFDFPDSRKREIVKTALFVDGRLVAENTKPPFDQFSWKLQDYASDGIHLLRIEATDSYGLTGNSHEIPVSISILPVKSNPWSTIKQNLPILAGLALLLSFAILLLVLIMGGQLNPSSHKASHRIRRKPASSTHTVHLPPGENIPAAISHWVSRIHWPHPFAGENANAYFRQIEENGDHPSSPPIAITQNEITIGRDPNLSTLILDDPSIDGLHARLVQLEDGSFLLFDEGSIAGTWINYSPISVEGSRLEHGDLVNFGRICFRFTLKQSENIRKPVISPGVIDQNFIEETIR